MIIDADKVKVKNLRFPGLDGNVQYDLNMVIEALLRAVVKVGAGGGEAFGVALEAIDRTVPLRIRSDKLGLFQLRKVYWVVENLGLGEICGFGGAAGADASDEEIVLGGAYDQPLLNWELLGGALCDFRVTVVVEDSCGRVALGVGTSLISLKQAIRREFDYRGVYQLVFVPKCATRMLAKVWGAGGHARSYLPTNGGGAGGYSEGLIAVEPGTLLHVLVGQGGVGGNSFGFAGVRSGGGGSGGGLSGVFACSRLTGSIQADEAELALIVAGGGGGATYAGTAAGRGGNGNDPLYSGGASTMQGAADEIEPFPARSWNAGGGGGYSGGGHHQRGSVPGTAPSMPLGGEGGAGFIVRGASGVKMLATPDGQSAAVNARDVDYQEGIGRGGAPGMFDGKGGNGLVVLYFFK